MARGHGGRGWHGGINKAMIGMLPQNDKEPIDESEATISRRSLSDIATGERSGYPSRQKPTPVRRHLNCYGRGSRVRPVLATWQPDPRSEDVHIRVPQKIRCPLLRRND